MTVEQDLIVVGCGGVGSAVLAHAARSGARVLGLERFEPVHDRGSSHGETRVIRLSYFEHPDYVPLLRRAYELWAALERDTGRRLYLESGLLQVGPPDGVVLPGVLASAREHGLEVERLEEPAARSRFPQFRLPRGCEAVFERMAGVLRVEDCVRAHLDLAREAGAELVAPATVTAIRPEDGRVRVETDGRVHTARRVVVTAGAWAAELLPGLPRLDVVRKSLFWFEGRGEAMRADAGAPAYFFETPDGMFYGFPALEGGELKVAEHTGGRVVTDPLLVDREVDDEEEQRATAFLAEHLPDAAGRRTRHAVCLYTRTPDEHFLVDRLPDAPRVLLAAGLSGHGFKFASALGEWLADVALERSPNVDPAFLGLGRFASGA